MAFNKLFPPILVASGLVIACAAYAADPPAQPAQPAQPAADSSTPVATPAPVISTPPAATPAATSATTKETPANKPASQSPSPEAQAEAQAASHLEKKFQEAARSYRQVQKNGQTMYCKKEKPINSTIPRMQCMSESELRLQVEQMDQLRDRMRNQGRCTAGTGCRSGG
jgi:hypothetical protein